MESCLTHDQFHLNSLIELSFGKEANDIIDHLSDGTVRVVLRTNRHISSNVEKKSFLEKAESVVTELGRDSPNCKFVTESLSELGETFKRGFFEE